MIPTFEQVYEFSSKIHGIYSEVELRSLYDEVVALPDPATIVEIGVLYGRSASVYFQVAKGGKPLKINLIDPWVVSEADTYMAFHGMIDKNFRDVPFTMHNKTSVKVSPWMTVDLLHVDGDHSPAGINSDCFCWLPRTLVAVFHDYNTRSAPEHGHELVFPQIKETVDNYCQPDKWQPLGVFDSQAKFRRVG